jgi:signal peptidase II
MGRSRRSLALFLGLVAGIVATDVVTKRLAVDALVPRYVPRAVIGDWVQLRLVYNQGAAFGLSVGSWSRPVFIVLTLVAVTILWRMFRRTRPDDWFRTTAIAMVVGGALGNLIDRLRSAQGVVDFVDVGIGIHRWPTFNVADMGVSVGAILLAWVLWQEDESAAHAPTGAPTATADTPPEVLTERSA